MLTDGLELLIARHLDGETTEAENRQVLELKSTDPEFRGTFLRAQAERSTFEEIRAASARHRPALEDIDEAMESLAHRATSEAQHLRSLEGGNGRDESQGYFMPMLKRLARGLLNPIPNLSGALAGALVIGLVLQVSPWRMVSIQDPVVLPGSGAFAEENVDFGPTRGISRNEGFPDTVENLMVQNSGSGMPRIVLREIEELTTEYKPSPELLNKFDTALDQIDVVMGSSDYTEAFRLAIEFDEKFPSLADHCSCPSYRLNAALAALYKWNGEPQEAGKALVREGACLASELGPAINDCLRTGQ